MLRVGTSGWSHPDWIGPFYPVPLREAPERWLHHYASRFRTVEIVSTADGAPGEPHVSRWCREGADLLSKAPFEFSLQLPRAITHDAVPRGDAEAARDATGRFDREVLDPLAGEGLLGAVLVELPADLPASTAPLRALQGVLGALAERRVAIQAEHASWSRQGRVAAEALPLFTNRDVCLVEREAPGLPLVEPPPARHAYVRCPGRPGARYPPAALEALGAKLRRREEGGRVDVRCVFGNVADGMAPADALALLHAVGEAPAGATPLRVTQQARLPG